MKITGIYKVYLFKFCKNTVKIYFHAHKLYVPTLDEILDLQSCICPCRDPVNVLSNLLLTYGNNEASTITMQHVMMGHFPRHSHSYVFPPIKQLLSL